jgi:hypothetical protein
LLQPSTFNVVDVSGIRGYEPSKLGPTRKELKLGEFYYQFSNWMLGEAVRDSRLNAAKSDLSAGKEIPEYTTIHLYIDKEPSENIFYISRI